MQLPAFLPNQFAHYSRANGDAQLFEQLVQQPSDLIIFFEYACDHETWSDDHAAFMRSAIQWMTTEFFNSRLSLESANAAVKAMQKHRVFLDPYIIQDIFVSAGTQRVAVNSMFAGVSSESIRQFIRSQCFEKGREELVLLDLPPEMLAPVVEFMNTGTIATIWRHSREDLYIFLRLAMKWNLQGIATLCQETLKRYIDANNVIEILLMAQDNGWIYLEKHCCAFINSQDWGLKCHSLQREKEDILTRESRLLALEFLEFNENSLGIFERIKLHITHLICSGYLTGDSIFGKVVRSCPRLLALDISRSRSFGDYLAETPPHLEELDISQCGWLRNGMLKQIIAICPNLRKLSLTSNVEISTSDWSELLKLKQLISLDIARCYQIRDEQFNLILKACPRIADLSIADCHQLTNKAFFLIAHILPQLVILNASRCHISDGLLQEIAVHCTHLRRLVIERCPEISERGIFQLVQQAPALHELDIKHCPISQTMIDRIRAIRPQLRLLS
jgi:hypothetical protein